jgi:hypothetical protein
MVDSSQIDLDVLFRGVWIYINRNQFASAEEIATRFAEVGGKAIVLQYEEGAAFEEVLEARSTVGAHVQYVGTTGVMHRDESVVPPAELGFDFLVLDQESDLLAESVPEVANWFLDKVESEVRSVLPDVPIVIRLHPGNQLHEQWTTELAPKAGFAGIIAQTLDAVRPAVLDPATRAGVRLIADWSQGSPDEKRLAELAGRGASVILLGSSRLQSMPYLWETVERWMAFPSLADPVNSAPDEVSGDRRGRLVDLPIGGAWLQVDPLRFTYAGNLISNFVERGGKAVVLEHVDGANQDEFISAWEAAKSFGVPVGVSMRVEGPQPSLPPESIDPDFIVIDPTHGPLLSTDDAKEIPNFYRLIMDRVGNRYPGVPFVLEFDSDDSTRVA